VSQMGNPAADAAMYRFYADMLETYGEEWPDRLLDGLTFDPDGPEIELPPPLESPEDVLIILTVRLTQPAYRRLKARADADGASVEDLIAAWADSGSENPRGE